MASTLYVSFTDATKATVNGVFAGPGNSTEVWPYQDSILSSDARYTAYYTAQGEWAALTGLIAPGD